jgi:DnaJ family protein C protein 25
MSAVDAETTPPVAETASPTEKKQRSTLDDINWTPDYSYNPKYLPMYDPNEKWCGEHDCYSVLGLQADDKPSNAAVKKAYRTLSRFFHPDKNTDTLAEPRFLIIGKAYKTLVNNENRLKYDFYKENPDAYIKEFGMGRTLYQYAPKSDVSFILIGLLFLFS